MPGCVLSIIPGFRWFSSRASPQRSVYFHSHEQESVWMAWRAESTSLKVPQLRECQNWNPDSLSF